MQLERFPEPNHVRLMALRTRGIAELWAELTCVHTSLADGV